MQRTGRNRWILAVRYGLPAVVVLVGVAFMLAGGEDNVLGGAGIVSAGAAIYMINFLFRIGASGDRDRRAEAQAREHFDKHGRWPDQRPNPKTPPKKGSSGGSPPAAG